MRAQKTGNVRNAPRFLGKVRGNPICGKPRLVAFGANGVARIAWRKSDPDEKVQEEEVADDDKEQKKQAPVRVGLKLRLKIHAPRVHPVVRLDDPVVLGAHLVEQEHGLQDVVEVRRPVRPRRLRERAVRNDGPDAVRAAVHAADSENGFTLARTMPVGPCIPVGIQL